MLTKITFRHFCYLPTLHPLVPWMLPPQQTKVYSLSTGLALPARFVPSAFVHLIFHVLQRHEFTPLLQSNKKSDSKSICPLRAASVSRAAEQNAADNSLDRTRDDRVLPRSVRSSFSSWEESAKTYFSRNVGRKLENGDERRRELYALYVQEGMDFTANNRKKDKKGVEKILKLAEKTRLKISKASKHDLNMAADNWPHQALVLDASPLELVDIWELEPIAGWDRRVAPLWIALDEVTDPQKEEIVSLRLEFWAKGEISSSRFKGQTDESSKITKDIIFVAVIRIWSVFL